MEYQEYPTPSTPDTDMSSSILICSLPCFKNNSKNYMYLANHFKVFVLCVLLCTVYFLVDVPISSPITMGNFDIPIIHTNYDLKEELNLASCEYVMLDDDNIELLSSTPTDLNVLQLNIRGLLNKQD